MNDDEVSRKIADTFKKFYIWQIRYVSLTEENTHKHILTLTIITIKEDSSD